MEKTPESASASAPNKVIIAGEHSVVYGGLALSAPVEVNGKRNAARASLRKGVGKIIIREKGYGSSTLFRGTKTGKAGQFPMLDAVASAMGIGGNNTGKGGKASAIALDAKDIVIDVSFSGAPKGTGNSASLSSAVISAACAAAGRELAVDGLFGLVMPAENAYHAGKASGIDPLTVCSDSAIEFQKLFRNGKPAFRAKKIRLSLPKGTRLILIDTSTGAGAKRSRTGDLINAFAKANGITKMPDSLGAKERARLVGPFDGIVKKIELELHGKGSAGNLGALLDENHRLLKEGGVSSREIEKAVSIARASGALGAKLTGAGGKGGSVIALVKERDAKKVARSLEKNGFGCYAISFSAKGAGTD